MASSSPSSKEESCGKNVVPEMLLLPSGFPGDSGTTEVPRPKTDVWRELVDVSRSSPTMLSPGKVSMLYLVHCSRCRWRTAIRTTIASWEKKPRIVISTMVRNRARMISSHRRKPYSHSRLSSKTSAKRGYRWRCNVHLICQDQGLSEESNTYDCYWPLHYQALASCPWSGRHFPTLGPRRLDSDFLLLDDAGDWPRGLRHAPSGRCARRQQCMAARDCFSRLGTCLRDNIDKEMQV